MEALIPSHHLRLHRRRFRYTTPILSIAIILKFVLSSAAEAELGALYVTAKEMISLRQALIEVGWPPI